MIEIRIITTEGCEGCRIMKNISCNAAEQINLARKINDVIVTSHDFNDESIRQFANRYQVKDYPATFIIKNNEVVDRIFGTTTKKDVVDRIENVI